QEAGSAGAFESVSASARSTSATSSPAVTVPAGGARSGCPPPARTRAAGSSPAPTAAARQAGVATKYSAHNGSCAPGRIRRSARPRMRCALGEAGEADGAARVGPPHAHLPDGEPRELQPERDVLEVVQVREQPHPLKYHVDGSLVRRSRGDVAAVEHDRRAV